MTSRSSFIFMLCLLALCLVAWVQAQREPEKAPSLNDAKTVADVFAYLNYAGSKLDPSSLEPKELAAAAAGILMPASEKMLELAESTQEKRMAYGMKLSAFSNQIQAGIGGAEQKQEAFLNELAAMAEFGEMAEQFRFQLLAQQITGGIEGAEQKLETFLKELDAKEKNDTRTQMLNVGQFVLFGEKAKKAEASPENFNEFKTKLKGWTYGKHVPLSVVTALGFEVALRNKVPAEQVVQELTEHIQASRTLPAEGKKELIEELESALRLAPGVDLKLYGKTLDNKDFDWKSLRGKYVLIKFTATWCGPCKMQIPDMLKAYNKYKSKGLEVVSVYVFERGADSVATVKKAVEEEKLPWIILSEALTATAGQPEHGKCYGIRGVPTMVVVDKEGKIMMPATHSDEWKKKLAEIFE